MILKGLSEENRELIIRYLQDMELGKNIGLGSKKGPRSYGRLRNQKSKLHSVILLIQEYCSKNSVKKVTEDELMNFFNGMRKGKFISKRTGRTYRAVGTYVKSFKAFWHWLMKASKREGEILEDITIDIDAREDYKPKFNYFTIEQLQTLCDHAKFDYKVIMMFMFDSGIRSPTELLNTRLSDLEWDNEKGHFMLNIRDDISKTFGRKIKLLLCSEILRKYVNGRMFEGDDLLFTKRAHKINEYISKLGYKLLNVGEGVYKGKQEKRKLAWIKNGISMYDFRHSSACYWLPRYRSESALKYRFGWVKSRMIIYYTEFLGMKDTIQHEDLYVDISKTELDRKISKLKEEITLRDEAHRAEMEKVNEQMEIIMRELAKKNIESGKANKVLRMIKSI